MKDLHDKKSIGTGDILRYVAKNIRFQPPEMSVSTACRSCYRADACRNLQLLIYRKFDV